MSLPFRKLGATLKSESQFEIHRFSAEIYMAKVVSFLSRILALVLFALSWTRVAVGRILPFFNPPQEPRSAKVFALTDAEWNELRAGRDVAGQEKSEPKSADAQQDKSENKNDQAKSRDCDKAAPKEAEDKGSQSGEDKKKDGPKPGECQQGPGGGDGDMGGGGG